MVFVLKKTGGVITKRAVAVNITAAQLNAISPASTSPSTTLVNTYASAPVIQSITLGGQPVSLLQSQVDYLSVTPGSAQASKALVLDSAGNIGGLGDVSCGSMIVNGNTLQTTISTASASVPTVDYFSGITPGAATASSLVAVDSSTNVSIPTLSAQSVGSTVKFNAPVSFGDFIKGGSLSYGQWFDMAWSTDLTKAVIVGTNKLAVVSGFGGALSSFSISEVDSSLDLRMVEWCPWIGMFVANGPAGVFRSLNGSAWLATSLTNVLFNGMIISPGANMLLAVADGMAYYSTNGTSWNSVTLSGSWSSIAVNSAGVAVAVGTNNMAYSSISTSPPLQTWSTVSFSGAWVSVCAHPSGFLACSSTSSNTGKLAYSVNGSAWYTPSEAWLTSGLEFVDQLSLSRVKYFTSKKLFMAVVSNNSAKAANIFVSKDAINWQPYRMSTPSRVVQVVRDPTSDSFVALGSGFGTVTSACTLRPCYMASPFSNSGLTRNWDVNGKIFGTGNGIVYSNDGQKFYPWSVTPSVCSNNTIHGITYSPYLDMYLAVGSTMNSMNTYYSTDGANWTAVNSGTVQIMYSVEWFPNYGKFIATVASASTVLESSNGTSWNPSTFLVNIVGAGPSQGYIRKVQGDTVAGIPPSIAYVYCSIGTKVATVTDLQSGPVGVKATYPPSNTNFNNICFAWGNLFLIDSSGVVMVSTNNGLNFSASSTTITSAYSIFYIPEIDTLFVGSSNNTLSYLTNGGSWVINTPIPGLGCIFYTWSPTYRCLFGTNSTVMAASRSLIPTVFYSLPSNTMVLHKSLPDVQSVIADNVDAVMVSFKSASFTKFTNADAGPHSKLLYMRNKNQIVMFGSYVSIVYSDLFTTPMAGYGGSDATFYIYQAVENLDGNSIVTIGTAVGGDQNCLIVFGSSLNSAGYRIHRSLSSSYLLKTYNGIAYFTVDGGFYRFTSIYVFSLVCSIGSSVDYACRLHSKTGTEEVVFVGSSGIRYWNPVTSTLSAVLAATTYTQVEYNVDAGVFVATGPNVSARSADGINWTTFTTTITPSKLKYIPELRVLVGFGNAGMVCVTFDGSAWYSTTTSMVANWSGIEYLPQQGAFLLITGDTVTGRICLLEATRVTSNNLKVIHNSSFYKNKAVLRTYNTYTNFKEPTHSLETNYNIRVDSTAGGSASILSASNGILNIGSGLTKNLALPNSDGITKGLYLDGTFLQAYASDCVGVLRQLGRSGKTLGYLAVGSTGMIQASNVDCTALSILPANSSSGVLTLDSSSVASVSKLSTSAPATIQNLTIKPPVSTTSASVLSNFRRVFSIGNGNTFQGMCYSPKLGMHLIVYTCPIASAHVQCAYSLDGGNTWGINSSIAASNPQGSGSTWINHAIWHSGLNVFMVSMNDVILYSVDGLNWGSVALTGAKGHFFYNNAGNIAISTNATKIYRLTNGADFTLTASWVLITPSLSMLTVEWMSGLSSYIGTISNSIYKSTDLITWTLVVSYASSINVAVDNVSTIIICALASSTGNIYRKTDLVTNVGTLVLPGVANASIQFNNPEFLGSGKFIAMHQNSPVISSDSGVTWSMQGRGYGNTGLSTYTTSVVPFWDGSKCLMLADVNIVLMPSNQVTLVPRRSVDSIQQAANVKLGGDNLLNPGIDSQTHFAVNSTKYDMRAIAYKPSTSTSTYNGSFLYAGVDTIMICPRLKYLDSTTISTVSGTWTDAIWDGGRWVIMSAFATAYSADGITWTTPAATTGGNNLVFAPTSTSPSVGVYAVSTTTGYSYSTDLQSWTSCTIPGTWNTIKFIPSKSTWVLLGVDKVAWVSTVDLSAVAPGNWVTRTVLGSWNDVAYGLSMYVLVGDYVVARSSTLSKFTRRPMRMPWTSVLYCSLWSRFYMCSKSPHNATINKNTIMSSHDGYSWVSNYLPNGAAFPSMTSSQPMLSFSRLYWFPDTTQFAAPCVATTSTMYIYLMYTDYADASKSQLMALPTTVRTRNGYLEVGNSTLNSTINKALSVFVDSAAKPGTSTWTITSDARVKEDIQPADLEVCWSNLKNIPLKYYKWKQSFLKATQTTDEHKLGWIAQDVEQVFPNAVNQSDMWGLPDCRDLNNDQLIATMWGVIQKLDSLVKRLEG